MERGLPHGRHQSKNAGAEVNTARLDRNDAEAVSNFIRANTKLLNPPLVPEIVLHLAEESMPIWEKAEEELGELNLPPPYWAFAWAGGQALARFLLDHAEFCRAQSVVDLGAGSGLTAIAAAKCGAFSVIAADVDEIALRACRMNAAANGVRFGTTSDDLLNRPLEAPEVLLVGDLFYERQLAESVLVMIGAAKAAGSVVLIGDPQRNYFPRDRFECLADYIVPVTRELEDAEIKRTAVWRA